MTATAIEPKRDQQPLEEPTPTLSRFRRGGGPALVILAVDIVTILIFGVLSPNYVFLQVRSFTNIALDSSETVLLGVGVAFLLGAAELDISLGANVILSSVVGGKAMAALAGHNTGLVIPVGCAVCILTGTMAGLFNALVVTRLRVNSFITTLASLGIMTGVADVLTNGYNLSNLPIAFQTHFGIATLWGVVPYPALVALVVVVVAAYVLGRTRFGLRTLALGSNREAAIRAGIPVRRNLAVLFMSAGLCAGIAGLIDLSRYTTTNLAGHQSDAMAAIAGAVIGGTALFGGRISVWGAALGTLLAVILQDGLVVIGLPSFYQLIAIGIVLIAAVSARGFSEGDGQTLPLLMRLQSLFTLTSRKAVRTS